MATFSVPSGCAPRPGAATSTLPCASCSSSIPTVAVEGPRAVAHRYGCEVQALRKSDSSSFVDVHRRSIFCQIARSDNVVSTPAGGQFSLSGWLEVAASDASCAGEDMSVTDDRGHVISPAWASLSPIMTPRCAGKARGIALRCKKFVPCDHPKVVI